MSEILASTPVLGTYFRFFFSVVFVAPFWPVASLCATWPILPLVCEGSCFISQEAAPQFEVLELQLVGPTSDK